MLIENVEGKDASSVEVRSKFAERLEIWALKAIEDCRLIRRSNAHGRRT